MGVDMDASPHHKQEFSLSLLTALLAAGLSLLGLLLPRALYPTGDLRRSFLSNDVVNLLIGLPALLAAMWSARRGSLAGLLFWPGALLYVTYNYIAYAVAMPAAPQFVPCLLLVLLSGYTVLRLFAGVDGESVRQRLGGRVPERFAGGVLTGLGALFFLRGVGQLAQAAVTGPELAVVIADLVITPLWIVGGILLWRKRPLGYVGGAGLLFQACMLFIALLVFFILQPITAGTPFPATDFTVIFAMGLVCFVPFGLFVRGILRNGR